MSSQLNTILEDSNLAEQLLSSAQTYGFVTSMAAAPNILILQSGLLSYGVVRKFHHLQLMKNLRLTQMLLLVSGMMHEQRC